MVAILFFSDQSECGHHVVQTCGGHVVFYVKDIEVSRFNMVAESS